MISAYNLGVLDYLIVVFTLLISTAIGIKFKSNSTNNGKMQEYFMAGRNMYIFPVVMSSTATMVSPLTTIGIPAESYKYGIQLWTMCLGSSIGMIIAAYVFIPVYYQCGVSTVYEYLEIRFGKPTRYFISAMFIIQMVLWMGSVLYSPVLAINAATNLPVEPSIIVFGVICSIYCAVGGLKAVLWTDVFQTCLMFITALMIFVAGINDVGGITNVVERVKEGGRHSFFNFQFDFTTRYTFWNGLFQGMFFGAGSYGTNQTGVQRLLSLSNIKRARWALLICNPLVNLLFLSSCLHGIVLYAVYFKCDPVLNSKETGLTKYDQMIPYYLVTAFHSIPGLTGLSIAGIFSGSLTSISSLLNSLATVTVIDFVHPIFKSLQKNERKSLLLAKGISLAYGVICVCVALTLTKSRSISQVGYLLVNTFEGPNLAVFTVGVLTRKGYGKSLLFGLLVGFSITQWIGVGSLLSGYNEAPLPLSTSLCTSPTNSTYDHSTLETSNITAPNTSVPSNSEFNILNKMPYFWMRPVGFTITLSCTLIAILISGWKTAEIPHDSKCLSPVIRLWSKNVKTPDHQKKETDNLTLTNFSSERH